MNAMQLLTMLHNVCEGASTPGVGYEDADIPYKTFLARLALTIAVPIEDVESALWSCNLMNEQKKFWHPDKKKFDEFLGGLKLENYVFDRKFNTLDRKKGSFL